MSTQSKRKKRLGIGVFRIKRGGLGKRIVVQVFAEKPIITHGYFEELHNDLYNNVENIQKCASASMDFLLPEIKYEWRLELPNSKNKFNVTPTILGKSEKAVRIIISEKGVSLVGNGLEQSINIAVLKATKDNLEPNFKKTTGKIENIKAKMHVSDVIDYTRCFFLDVIMANSLPQSPIVKKYIEEKGFKSFFRKKVLFAIKHEIKSSRFGFPNKNADYVSFSSLCIENGKVDYLKYIKVWDDFLFEEVNDYFPSLEKIFSQLNSKPSHRNQINKKKFFNKLSSINPGIHVILLPYDNPKREIHFNKAISQYGFSANCKKHWHRQIGVITWDQFISLKNELIDNNYVEPFKIYIK